MAMVVYRKSHDFPDDFINDRHRALAFAEWQIHDGKKTSLIKHAVPGKLKRFDAAKIYELAYFAKGDTVDIGTNRGLSAAIASDAIKDSGRRATVHTVDINEKMNLSARRNLAAYGADNVAFVLQDAVEWIDGLDKTFDFIFVDHTHYYEPVLDLCKRLAPKINHFGCVAFHDFLDGRNNSETSAFGVRRAAFEGLDPSFKFWGTSAVTGVFQRIEGYARPDGVPEQEVKPPQRQPA